MAIVLEAIRRLREEWALRPRHPYLSPPDCVPTVVRGGEWIVSYPARCALDCHIEYLPEQADARRLGRPGRARVQRLDRPRRGRRPVARRASAARSSGASAACRRRRSRPTTRSSRRRSPPPARRLPRAARRARQLARRRDADRRGRNPGDLLRTRRHPPRPHHRRIGADRRTRGLRAGARGHRPPPLRPGDRALTSAVALIERLSLRLLSGTIKSTASRQRRRALRASGTGRLRTLGDVREAVGS